MIFQFYHFSIPILLFPSPSFSLFAHYLKVAHLPPHSFVGNEEEQGLVIGVDCVTDINGANLCGE